MVGIVIVSHSKNVAEGVRELALQMAGEHKKIIACGGMEDGSIGTDTVLIMDAIKEANDGDGVCVLCDLGSAILSTQTALDLLDEPIKAVVADAPILEGAISCAIPA
ncbi:MAG: PTS-dependent dihydroxyacetone kinase phosphotransferase subunit DhaM, partial [Lachnospiraceae bacterium]|nr:PTS-dependent dihydroxyacetone kinase phosphotransferase subunit DhaM [Lachnospiraceae bacterium]